LSVRVLQQGATFCWLFCSSCPVCHAAQELHENEEYVEQEDEFDIKPPEPSNPDGAPGDALAFAHIDIVTRLPRAGSDMDVDEADEEEEELITLIGVSRSSQLLARVNFSAMLLGCARQQPAADFWSVVVPQAQPVVLPAGTTFKGNRIASWGFRGYQVPLSQVGKM
jgi:hypothetical protein